MGCWRRHRLLPTFGAARDIPHSWLPRVVGCRWPIDGHNDGLLTLTPRPLFMTARATGIHLPHRGPRRALQLQQERFVRPVAANTRQVSQKPDIRLSECDVPPHSLGDHHSTRPTTQTVIFEICRAESRSRLQPDHAERCKRRGPRSRWQSPLHAPYCQPQTRAAKWQLHISGSKTVVPVEFGRYMLPVLFLSAFADPTQADSGYSAGPAGSITQYSVSCMCNAIFGVCRRDILYFRQELAGFARF
jgi:hypothetical protein